MPQFLHIGCGPKTKAQTTAGFNTPDWQETRLDIDPAVKPDIQFASIASRRRGAPFFDLWAVASKPAMDEAGLRALAAGHILG